MGAQHRPDVVGLPGADAETVSHLGRVGCLDKLALPGGSRLVLCADQKRIGHGEAMLTLRLVEGERSLIEKSPSALGVVYNTGHHGMSSCWNRENGLQLFYSGGVPW